MRKIIRNIRYFLYFNKSSKRLKCLTIETFINDYKIQNPKIKVSFRFGYAKDFYRPSDWFGTRQIGIIREDYQNGCFVSSFLTIKQYIQMNNVLKYIK